MKKILLSMLMLSFSVAALAGQPQRSIELPQSFNAFYHINKDRIEPSKTHMTCRFENRHVGMLMQAQPFRLLSKVDGNYYVQFIFAGEVLKAFESNSFDVDCFTSEPGGFSCKAQMRPGEYIANCQ